MKNETNITRETMVELLNEDLAREYQAIITQEQEHTIALCDALGFEVPKPKKI